MSDESSDSAGLYQVVIEQRASSLLKVEWKGKGRDINSGQPVDVPESDARRKTFIDINFASPGPMLWRSNLERRLKTERLTPADIRTEPLENFDLVRATIVIEPGMVDFFFKRGVGPDLDGRYYVARCSMPYAWEKGAVHCSTQLKVESSASRSHLIRHFCGISTISRLRPSRLRSSIFEAEDTSIKQARPTARDQCSRTYTSRSCGEFRSNVIGKG